MADDVIYITGWDSESKILRNKNFNWPIDIKKVYPEDFESLNISIPSTVDIKEGLILVKNPFEDNSYIEFDKAKIQITNMKSQFISEILQYLGAKSFRLYSYEKTKKTDEKKLTVKANAKIKTKADEEKKKEAKDIEGTSTTEIHHKDRDESETKYERTDTFVGEWTKENYEKAKALALKYGFYNDFDIKKLIEQRNPDESIIINSRKIEIDMTREFEKYRNRIINLDVPKYGYLNINYERTINTYNSVEYIFDVQF